MATLGCVTGDSYFEGEERSSIARALDRDARAGVLALFCALALGAAVSGAGRGAAPPPAGVTPAQSQAQAVLGEGTAAPAAAAAAPVHAVSGGS